MNSEIVDVLVAGAGAAGLSAALSAAETGLDVVVVEANRSFRSSSNTAMSTSMIPAGGSRWQAEASIDDSPSQFYDDIMAKTRAFASANHPSQRKQCFRDNNWGLVEADSCFINSIGFPGMPEPWSGASPGTRGNL